MGPVSLFRNILRSYAVFARLFFKTFFKSRHTQARLTLKRFLVMSGFLPLLLVVQTVHWIGFVLDEIFFRGYRSVTISRPLFIVGVPRSGTTFLHRVLSNDTGRFTTLTLWELLFAPSVTQRKLLLFLGKLDSKAGAPVARTINLLQNRVFRSLDNIHRISLSDPEEDYFLLVPVFACLILILPFPFQEELMYLAAFDDQADEKHKARIMMFYRSCIQRHLYARGENRVFFSKNVAFSAMIGTLDRYFPDCRIVGTVRNPLEAVPSHISSMMAGAAIFDNDPRGHEFRDQLIGIQRYACTNILEKLSRLPENRQAVVRMEDLKTGLYDVIMSLYARLGYDVSAPFDAFVKAQDRQEKAYKSGHSYTLSDFDLTAETVYHIFKDVFEKMAYAVPPKERS